MENRPKGRNRRRAQRQDAAFTLVYGIEKPYALRVSSGLSDDLDAIMLDLSDSGVAMLTDFDLPEGTRLRIRFNFMNLFLFGQERSRRMEITGEVVSRREVTRGNYRIGIRFYNIPEADKEAIRNFVKRSKWNEKRNTR